MPIRFRCVYCNQLLGISRRKAGTIVRCTTCEGQLIVPDPSDANTETGSEEHVAGASPPQPGGTPAPADRGGVFDRDEFDAFLEPLGPGGGPAVVSPPAPAQRPAPAHSGLEPALVPALTLTRRGLTVAIVTAIMALAVSFAGGYWLGFALR